MALPHYGHMATGYVKDLVPRFRTMQGRRVERRFGWDTHGLPAEMAAEKELGISGRIAILDYGMDKFNDYCRESVLRYTNDWQYYVERMGRWVDFENDYKTMDPTFMESVLWAFKTLYDKGLVYRGSRVVPYSWAMQTPLSNFETRLDNSYRERQDPALTVLFKLKEPLKDGKPAHLAAWTTTPWTLPSNLALAVGPTFDYAILEKDGVHVVVAEALVEAYAALSWKPMNRSAPSAARIWRGASMSRCLTSSPMLKMRSRCSPPIMSRWRAAPASSTPRPLSVRTIWRWVVPTACR